MEIELVGGNSVAIMLSKLLFAVDPKFSDSVSKEAKVYLLTQPEFGVQADSGALIIDCPGEYEIGGVSVKGIAAQAHNDDKDVPFRATIFKIYNEEFSAVVLGQIAPDLSEEQLEAIGVIDAVVLPVGGEGDTLTVDESLRVVRKISPKIVVPIYKEEQEAQTLATQLAAKQESVSKLKLKTLPVGEGMTIYLLGK
ncbi:MAG TPA: MBL fold metallo-hydrolase [Patescibacteria group bacterium]|jgi:L-ascorbate metabolism protein UlaG (beta-lactamase superfamily)|nr:MBL fold metallo-hydrolase [Patescibacteria group bacterium]